MVWNYANLWESVADTTPDRPALIHGERRLSWRDFDRRANALAKAMVTGEVKLAEEEKGTLIDRAWGAVMNALRSFAGQAPAEATAR